MFRFQIHCVLLNDFVAVKGNIIKGMKSRGMLMVIRLLEMSIIQQLLMHLV